MGDWHISQALQSARQLNAILSELTEADLEAAIELEQGSRRRKSILNRLAMRLSALRAEKTRSIIQEKIHGASR